MRAHVNDSLKWYEFIENSLRTEAIMSSPSDVLTDYTDTQKNMRNKQ